MRDAKTIKERGPGKRHASAAGIPSGEEGEKPSDIVEIPKGDQASQSFKRSVVKEMFKSRMAVRRNISK